MVQKLDLVQDDLVWSQMDDGMGEQLVLWVRAPRGDILRSDQISVPPLFVSPKLPPGLVELRNNPENIRQVMG